MKSPAYWHPWLYDLFVKYVWRHDRAMLESIWDAVMEHIPEQVDLLEIAAGTALLYRNRLKGHVKQYRATDINPQFVSYMNRLGIQASVADIRKEAPEKADCIVMLQALYNFKDDAERILKSLAESAEKCLILIEPVDQPLEKRNLRNWIRASLVDIGEGSIYDRFSSEELLSACQKAGRLIETRMLKGSYRLVVLDTSASGNG